ncbi:TonB-dependent siderophore receptor [Rhodoferax koreense]|uniref:TonB-dependent siderophore receptor n=2 Tax=Rhodoferax koreensis TaxID=1842727 RepID=A0A1P8K3Z4_9BURK|nr:TonB-dependent siderophore receptor [Rhodoferax koreense]
MATSLCLALPAMAQTAPSLAPVTVNAETAARQADVTGFGDTPLAEVPLSATVIGAGQLQASGARRLADLTQFDASVADAYNSPGYWDFLSIRGFTLDNRFNYRREGLPISAETSIPLDNKERVEILRGTSGIQSGTSAPGGLVNYVVKRPTEHDLRSVTLEASGGGSVLGAVDLGGRFGVDRVFGYRLNVAHETLRPLVHNLDGHRDLAALAADWRVGRDTVVEAEFEWSHKSQPSQAGTSLIGNRLPAVPDPKLNLNNQPWSQPSVFDAFTGSLRIEQAINDNWRWTGQLGSQRLKTDDRLAYPFGCGAEGNYDRFCSDGTFDFYDFRSENERRLQQAASLGLKGKLQTGAVLHDVSLGLIRSRVHNRFEQSAYNYVGTGNIDGTAVVPADPALTTPNTNRDERSLELSLSDAVHWTPEFTTWLGLRHTRLNRSSMSTDGNEATSYATSLTTPWVAASYKLAAQAMVYASYGEGAESQVVPDRPLQYANAGQALPVLKSRQFEVGLKGGDNRLGWQLAYFRIQRPATNIDACAATTPCEATYDGDAVHKGLEASGQWRAGPWQLDGGVTLLDAKRRGSTADPAANGKRPTNVPDWALRARAAYAVAAVAGLRLEGTLSHEGRRAVLSDESIMLGGWTRVDAALRYDTRIGATNTAWTFGVDNLFDRRYFRESPYQFGHVYLFTGAPRTFRIAMTASL